MMLTRQMFYEQFREHFSWFDVDEYACFDVLPIQPELVHSIQQATTDVWRVLCAASEVIRCLDDVQLLNFGYPLQTFDLIRTTTQPPFIARCDFAVNSEGIYLLECNAEVATFIVETFLMNGKVASYFGCDDPNAESQKILQRELNSYLQTAAAYICKPLEDCHIVFAALSCADEDIGTAQYMRSLCSLPSTFCPIEQIEMDELGVYDRTGIPIDILYRIYPTEWMVDDQDPTSGVSLWQVFEPLLFQRKVALINPVSTFVLQNKALLALTTQLWGNSNDSPFSEIIQKHFLPTFMDSGQLPLPYVAKPTYGREGNEVKIVSSNTEKTYNPSHEYAQLLKVYQKYVELPTIELDGDEFTLQYSCFLVNGIATGIGARIGNTVIGNTSYFLPLGYE